LIPSKHDNDIRRIRSKTEIVQMADLLGISTGIVAGRYQFLTGNRHYFKELIRTLDRDTT